jgi:hypothetical protein
MKKIYLAITFLLISSMMLAQFKQASVPEDFKNLAVPVPNYHPDGTVTLPSVFIPGMKDFEDEIGTTMYDLQTYNSLHKRIYAYDDGTIGATYMRSMTTVTWDDRGTAYRYYDGASWGDLMGHIESVRTGWPCYAPYGPNGEITVSHYAEGDIFGLKFCKRDNKGQGDWEEFELMGPEGFSIVWPAMITNGEDNMNIHILALTWGDPYEDMVNALLYYRSTDGGETWDIEHELLDDINADYFYMIDSDNYSWAMPRANTLAFSVGFKTQDGYIMKSTDNGDSWEKIEVFDSPYSPYLGGETPTFGSGDATQAVALDSEGNAHVVFGRMRHYYDAAGDLFYYPFTEGIVYWKEGMEVLDTTTVSSVTLEYLEEGGNLIGWVIPYEGDSTLIDVGTYYASLTSHPQINIDENDNIYVMWAGAAPGFDNIDFNYRHILGTGSTDGGDWWTGPKDYTNSIFYIFSECMYPVMSPNFPNDQVYFTFQEDAIPGIHIWTEEHQPVENSLKFMSVPTDDFLVGINDRFTEISLPVAIRPNPVSDNCRIDFRVEKTDWLNIRLFDLSGRSMIQIADKKFAQGNHHIELDTGHLTPGSYVVMVNGTHYRGSLKLIKL